MMYRDSRGGISFLNFSVSVDRIDNTLGDECGNIRLRVSEAHLMCRKEWNVSIGMHTHASTTGIFD